MFMFRCCLSCLLWGMLAGLDATETGNELSQPKFQFVSLLIEVLLFT